MSTYDPLCLVGLLSNLPPQRGAPDSVPDASEPVPPDGVAGAAMAYVAPQDNAGASREQRPPTARGAQNMRDAAKAGRPLVGLAPGSAEPSDFADRDTGSVGRRSVKDSGASGLSDLTQARIGNQLKSLYDSILQQPVPDRFRDLIDRLDSEKPETP